MRSIMLSMFLNEKTIREHMDEDGKLDVAIFKSQMTTIKERTCNEMYKLARSVYKCLPLVLEVTTAMYSGC